MAKKTAKKKATPEGNPGQEGNGHKGQEGTGKEG